jgi:hypothetical protein
MVRQELTLDSVFVLDPQPNAVANHLRLGHHASAHDREAALETVS